MLFSSPLIIPYLRLVTCWPATAFFISHHRPCFWCYHVCSAKQGISAQWNDQIWSKHPNPNNSLLFPNQRLMWSKQSLSYFHFHREIVQFHHPDLEHPNCMIPMMWKAPTKPWFQRGCVMEGGRDSCNKTYSHAYCSPNFQGGEKTKQVSGMSAALTPVCEGLPETILGACGMMDEIGIDQWPWLRNRWTGGTYHLLKAEILGDIPTKYGQTYGTNVPPF